MAASHPTTELPFIYYSANVSTVKVSGASYAKIAEQVEDADDQRRKEREEKKRVERERRKERARQEERARREKERGLQKEREEENSAGKRSVSRKNGMTLEARMMIMTVTVGIGMLMSGVAIVTTGVMMNMTGWS